jgi:hypothetical protein
LDFGTHNWMTYITRGYACRGVRVALQILATDTELSTSRRLHYFNPQTGHEFSAVQACVQSQEQTRNIKMASTYLDRGASQF